MPESTGRKIIRQWKLILGVVVGLLIGLVIHWALIPTQPHEDDHTKHAQQQATRWTCSMHPQVDQPKPGLCPICNMKLIPLKVDSDGKDPMHISFSENAKALMDIETVAVERKFVTAEVRMVGKIDYDDTRLAHITAWVPGRLDRLFVDYAGIKINEGDHMVEIFSPDLLAAQEEFLQAYNSKLGLTESDSKLVRESVEATFLAAREKLTLLGLTDKQIEELVAQGKSSDRLTIYASIGGIVIDKHVQQGAYVKTGTRIYTIADLSKVWVRLDAYESDLAWLRYGQMVEFTTESLPGRKFSGMVSFIDPVLTEKTRTVKVRVNAENADAALKPGMFIRSVVRSEITSGGKVIGPRLAGKWISPMHPEIIKDAPGDCDICGMPLVKAESLNYASVDAATAKAPLVIPASAVLRTGKRAIVYVDVPETDEPTFEMREITLGARAGESYLVEDGLSEGERVVVKGNFKIDSERQIQGLPSMMDREGAKKTHEHRH